MTRERIRTRSNAERRIEFLSLLKSLKVDRHKRHCDYESIRAGLFEGLQRIFIFLCLVIIEITIDLNHDILIYKHMREECCTLLAQIDIVVGQALALSGVLDGNHASATIHTQRWNEEPHA